jgi:hypothetical protein
MSDLTPVNQNSISSLTDADPNPGIDMSSLLLEVELEGYNIQQNAVHTRVNEMNAQNNLLSDIDNALGLVDAQNSPDSTSDTAVTISVSQQVWAEIQGSGIPIVASGKNPDGTEMVECGGQRLAAFLKDKVQALSNGSQMDMIQLQSQMNNLNQTMETATAIMQKASDTKDKIIQNIH